MSESTSSTGTEIQGMPIANIALAEIINEVTGQRYYFDTAEKADIKPDLSKGKEDILRVKNRIIAMNRTEDICIGYNIKLTDNTFPPELMCLVDGGTMTSSGYEGPQIGVAVNKTPFTLNLYSEEKDYDSSTVKYVKFGFKHNKGTPVEFKFEDGKFYVPEFESHSRPKKGEKPVYIEYVDRLPNGDESDDPTKPSSVTVPDPPTPTSPDSSKGIPGVTVGTDCRVTWTFADAVNDADVTAANFKVTKKSDGSVVTGNVTMDTTKKIITFIPTSIAAGVTYEATANAVRKADGSGNTTAITVEFTTA
ncbi:Ig-like domain-containing protein [Clostridium sp. JN-1]|uniref:Ig-like domain-containing protein n=1 Tax=Clostridium sp. JN-1 TaxID=2483110 RepID=UPI000F0B407A|nr:Ig-like domain-containing protein [Clostridium sp. JN-1]